MKRSAAMMVALVWYVPFPVAAQTSGWVCTIPAVFPETGNDIVRYWVEGNRLFESTKLDAVARKYGMPQDHWTIVINNAQGLVGVAADAGILGQTSYVWGEIITINKVTGDLHDSSFHTEEKTDTVTIGRCIAN